MAASQKYQLVAALLLTHHGNEAGELCRTLGEEEKVHVQNEIQSWMELEEISRQALLQRFVKSVGLQQELSGLSEIHPAWLVEPLKSESPRVVGAVLRHIPSKHVRYILEHLPAATVAHLPKLIESFCVPQEVLALVRRRFERHFLPMQSSKTLRKFDFSHLYYLKNEDLELLFRDLGISELAMALAGTSKKIAQAVLNRLSVEDARELADRIKKYRETAPDQLAEARYTLLELGGKQKGSESFLREVGLAALSKAFMAGDDFLHQALRQKLDPAHAYLLKRYIDQNMQRMTVKTVQNRRKWILDHVSFLSQRGRIDPLWANYLMAEAA